MTEPRLWEKVRKCELQAQKLSLTLQEVVKEIRQLEESPDTAKKGGKSVDAQ